VAFVAVKLHGFVEEDGWTLTASSKILLGRRVGVLAGELNFDELDRLVGFGCFVGVRLVHVRSLVFAHGVVVGVVGDHTDEVVFLLLFSLLR